jgi:hypothetical protein
MDATLNRIDFAIAFAKGAILQTADRVVEAGPAWVSPWSAATRSVSRNCPGARRHGEMRTITFAHRSCDNPARPEIPLPVSATDESDGSAFP